MRSYNTLEQPVLIYVAFSVRQQTQTAEVVVGSRRCSASVSFGGLNVR